jgi:BlaI family transcriptional regulator, penicillinase repressor
MYNKILMMNKMQPTEAELEILKILWEKSPESVRYVNEKQNEIREVGYTTTLKMMQIMNEKGLLSRDGSSRTHLYSTAIPKSETQDTMVTKIVNTVFGGSAAGLVMHALGGSKTTSEELSEIKALIDKLEKSNSDE